MSRLIDRAMGALSRRRRRDLRHAGNAAAIADRWLTRLFADRTVRHGPFAGMAYATDRAAGSALLPKLMGSYERELHEEIERALATDYDAFVDIGCAEGYYAVGLARRRPGVRVIAADTDPAARELCQAMAERNGVAVELLGSVDREALLSMDLGERALVLSDCEGYERTLFDAEVAERLAPHDVIVETHDFLDIGITRHLEQSFAATHDCRLIESVDDILKAYTYDYPELVGLTLAERREVLAEQRPVIMRWLVARSRQAPHAAGGSG